MMIRRALSLAALKTPENYGPFKVYTTNVGNGNASSLIGRSFVTSAVRNHSVAPEEMGVYRLNQPPVGGIRRRIAKYMMAFVWFWVFHNFWYRPHFLFGEYFDPDVTLWTDEDLGIPLDDYDEEV